MQQVVGAHSSDGSGSLLAQFNSTKKDDMLIIGPLAKAKETDCVLIFDGKDFVLEQLTNKGQQLHVATTAELSQYGNMIPANSTIETPPSVSSTFVPPNKITKPRSRHSAIKPSDDSTSKPSTSSSTRKTKSTTREHHQHDESKPKSSTSSSKERNKSKKEKHRTNTKKPLLPPPAIPKVTTPASQNITPTIPAHHNPHHRAASSRKLNNSFESLASDLDQMMEEDEQMEGGVVPPRDQGMVEEVIDEIVNDGVMDDLLDEGLRVNENGEDTMDVDRQNEGLPPTEVQQTGEAAHDPLSESSESESSESEKSGSESESEKTSESESD